MHEVLKGVRVLEVAQYVFVPTAGGVLAEWGADVVKVEQPSGDPARRIRMLENVLADLAEDHTELYD